MIFTLTPDQTWTVWSRDTKAGTFIGSFARHVVSEILRTLSDGTRAVIDDTDSILSDDFSSFQSSLSALLDTFNSYLSQHDAGIPEYVALIDR